MKVQAITGKDVAIINIKVDVAKEARHRFSEENLLSDASVSDSELL